MTGRAGRGVETADGARFVTGCALTPAGAPPDTDRDLELVRLAAASGVQLVQFLSPTEPAVDDLARDLGLMITHDLGLTGSRRLQRLGWVQGDERDLPQRLRRPSLRPPVVLAFGAPSVAKTDDATSARAGATPDDLACIERHTPRAAFADDDAWAQATRDYQAMVVRFHVEAVRALERPAAIVAGPLWQPTSGLGPSLLGQDLGPKEAYRALTAACRRQLAIADRLPPHLHGDEALALDVRLLNDSAEAIRGARVTATLRWADGEQQFHFGADAGAGTARRLGSIQVVVPPVSGPLTLDVDLDLAGDILTSTYRSEIFADPHEH